MGRTDARRLSQPLDRYRGTNGTAGAPTPGDHRSDRTLPHQVLFGTDQIPPRGREYETHFRLLETPDESFPHSAEDPFLRGRWPIYGLDLTPDFLELVYCANVQRLVPRLTGDRQQEEAR